MTSAARSRGGDTVALFLGGGRGRATVAHYLADGSHSSTFAGGGPNAAYFLGR